MDKIYTAKQLELLKLWQCDKLKRINLLEGSVRSGKTWISLVLWAFWVCEMPKDNNYLMVAKTLTSLRRNCLDLLQDLIGTDNFTYSLSKKEGRLFGRLIYFEGVNDARSESKIRGMTLQGAYCDELTLFSEDFFTMLLSRLSIPNAKLIATTNPDTPNHWLMKKYISVIEEKNLDMMTMKFLLEDNTFNDAVYIENLKKEFTGVFYERFILGHWVVAEGTIYKEFADNPNKFIIDEASNDIILATIGIDFGGNGSAHAFVCTGLTKSFKEVITLEEYYRKEIISATQLENDFIDFVRMCKSKYKNIIDVYCDSAEQVLIQGLKIAVVKNNLLVNIHNAVKGEIINRIRFYTSIMSQNRYRIMSQCTHTIDALKTAVWDSKSLEDKRLDNGTSNIDSLDAMEYSIEKYMKQIIDLGLLRR